MAAGALAAAAAADLLHSCCLHSRSYMTSEPLTATLKDSERAPRIFKVGNRTLVSVEAATEWRARMEALSVSARAA